MNMYNAEVITRRRGMQTSDIKTQEDVSMALDLPD
jgi:hypothetical protein